MKLRSFFKVTPKIITPKEKRVVLGNFASLSTLQGLGYILPILILPYLIRIIGAGEIRFNRLCPGLCAVFHDPYRLRLQLICDPQNLSMQGG